MTMMKEEDIRSLIVGRLGYLNEGKFLQGPAGPVLEAVIGQMRILVAVLDGGCPPGYSSSLVALLDAAHIPHQPEGDMIGIPEDWLVAHGFVQQPSGRFDHPIYSGRW